MSRFSIREEIKQIVKELNFNREDFMEVSKYQWKQILLKTEEQFVQKTHYTQGLHWAWVRLKAPNIAIRFTGDNGYKYINDIVNDEYVWFVVEDSHEKMWVYEGKPYIISKIIGESSFINEYYIISKKYKWILCENHHCIMEGSGEKIINQISKFKSERPELIFHKMVTSR